MAKSKKNLTLTTMNPEQIRERGKELLRLAQEKEKEIKQRQLIALGEIFKREIQAGWPSAWERLADELESILESKIEPPHWCQAGVQGGCPPWRKQRRRWQMASLNRVMLIGNLGKDPEVRYTTAGQAVASF